MAKLRVGFIGAGRIADLHALVYRDPSTLRLHSGQAGSGQAADAEPYAVCAA